LRSVSSNDLVEQEVTEIAENLPKCNQGSFARKNRCAQLVSIAEFNPTGTMPLECENPFSRTGMEFFRTNAVLMFVGENRKWFPVAELLKEFVVCECDCGAESTANDVAMQIAQKVRSGKFMSPR